MEAEAKTSSLTSRVNIQGQDFNRTLTLVYLKQELDAETLLKLVNEGHKIASSFTLDDVTVFLLEIISPAKVQVVAAGGMK